MTILDLINSPDPANWELALTIANTKELAEIAATLRDQIEQHYNEYENAKEEASDCSRIRIMLETEKHDVERAWIRAKNAAFAAHAAREKLRAVLDIINANQLKLPL